MSALGVVRSMLGGVPCLLACACSVPALDVTGMACTDTCPGGIACVDGVCGGRDGAVAADVGSPDSTSDATPGDAAGDALDAQAPIRFVQSSQGLFEGPNVSSFDCTLSTVTTGDLLVAAVNFAPQPGISVSVEDSQGNGYQPAILLENMAIFYAANVSGSAGSPPDGGVAAPFRVTALLSPPTGGLIFVHEYAGVSAIQPRDQENGGTGNVSGGTVSSGAVTATANELLFGFGRSDVGVAQQPSTGFMGRVYAGGAYSEDSVGPAPGAYDATFTPLGDAGGTWTALIASFHGAP